MTALRVDGPVAFLAPAITATALRRTHGQRRNAFLGLAPVCCAAFYAIVHYSRNGVLRFTFPDGDVWEFHDLDQFPSPAGALKRMIATGGQTIEVVAYTAAEQIAEVRRTTTGSGGSTITESFLYAYMGEGENGGRLESLTLRRREGTGAWSDLRRVRYTYYATNESFGSRGDLKTVTNEIKTGEVWSETGTWYYRYYTSGESNGFVHGLRFTLAPEAYAALAADGEVGDPLAASNGKVAEYASYEFEYDSQRRVLREKVAGGSREYAFSYQEGTAPDGYNDWRMKTTETLPDGTQRVVYTNHLGQVLLREFISGDDRWIEYWQYDEYDGRLVLSANPSAIASYVDDGGMFNDEISVTFRTAEGLIRESEYYTATDPENGAVAGKKRYDKAKKGSWGTPVLFKEYRYTQQTAADGHKVQPIAEEIIYRNEDGTGAITTSFGFAWHPDTLQMLERVVTLPAVPTDQNGSGT